MSTVLDIATLACADCGETGSTMLNFALTHVREKYRILYNIHPWFEAMAEPPYEFNASLPISIPFNSSQGFYQPSILPAQYETVRWLKASTDGGLSFPYIVKPRTRHWIEKNDGSALFTTPTPEVPRYFYLMRPVAFPAYGCGVLTFTPVTSASTVVTIEGVDLNGNEQFETVTLNGTTANSSVNSYQEVHTISQSPYPGSAAINITASLVSNTVRWQPELEQLRFCVFVGWPAFNWTLAGFQGLRFKVGSKLRIDNISQNGSVPRVSLLEQVLYYFTRSAVLHKQKQYDQEKADIQLADQLLKDIIQKEMASEASFFQITPRVYDTPSDVWDGDIDGGAGLWH